MARKKQPAIQGDIKSLPVLGLDDTVVFPMIAQPIKVEEESVSNLLDECLKHKSEIFVIWNSDPHLPTIEQTTTMGVICKIDKMMQLPGMPSLVFVIPLAKGYLRNRELLDKTILGEVLPLSQIEQPKKISIENKLMLGEIENNFNKLISYLMEPDLKNARSLVDNNSSSLISRLYAMAHVAPLNLEEKYEILTAENFDFLLETILRVFDAAAQRVAIQASIHERTHRELTRQQKESFLRTHLRQIQEELGDSEFNNDDIHSLSARSKKKNWNEATADFFKKELDKLKRLNLSNPEYSVQYSYLDTFLNLPWLDYNNKDFTLKKVETILNRDHFGLEKVKERIIEQMAVIKQRSDLKSPIICLFGPPGVGKTSIGKSIAEALDREYCRISLGGVHDEAEIRGHRRTYIGAMPGRFMQALSKCKSGNPLILLDEIDKVGKDYKGDPSSALLEALDPEQNNTFHDNFIDYPYDLSKVLFIATANDLSTIPAPLRDRMEVIEISGYIPEEKREIAYKHLVTKSLDNTGFKPKEITFTKEALEKIIRFYTREAGVRQLEKKITKILRKIARLKISGEKYPKKITPQHIEKFLGKYEYDPESYEKNDCPGVATGLAWTPSGGDILFIETSLSPGKGEKLTLTGNLGDVMKESAMIALQYLKAHATEIGIPDDSFRTYDIHIHVPEGAVPKDGPSAGITIATSLASAFLKKPLKEKLAMTGEITLRGKVLPVGGVKEKIIAARQGGIHTIILSADNKKDIDEIQPQYIEGLNFIYVKSILEVIRAAI